MPEQARVHLGANADWVALTTAGVWAASARPDMVQRIDPRTNRVDARVPLPGTACAGLATGFGSLWVPVCGLRPAIVRIDLARARIQAVLPLEAVVAESGIAIGGDSLWAPLDGTGRLARLDPETGRVRAMVAVARGTFNPLYADGMIWATSGARRSIAMIDPAVGRTMGAMHVGPQPRFLASGFGALWALNQGDGTVDRIDLRTRRRIATIPARSRGRGGDIAAGEGYVWTTVAGTPLTAIDPATNTVVRQWTGPGGDSLRVGFGSVWLTDLKRGDLVRLSVPALLAPAPIAAKSAAPARSPRR